MNKWKYKKFNKKSEQGTFVPIVQYICRVQTLLKSVINQTDEDSVNTEYKHSANGNEGNNTNMESVKTTAEIDDAIDRKKVYYIKQCNVEDEPVFMNVPVEKA